MVVGRGAGEVRSVGSDVDEMRNIGMNGMKIGEGVHAHTPCTPRGRSWKNGGRREDGK